ncbi:hypothetical protein HF576_11135 [Microbacterium sp. CFH 90308]|uniref:Sortase family protein n=1 Tax=Microbacterium salsuginis TaxID=2722803 RepID=A0ABX1KBK5_9MICO|nr:hypothetical protein [Microbacterium sp. CFH 90308]NLP84407.1 hypothetical protein [Microbacterium sp. CFH 90308]
MSAPADPFRDVHRANRRRVAVRGLVVGLAASAIAAAGWILPGAVAASPSSVTAQPAATAAAVDTVPAPGPAAGETAPVGTDPDAVAPVEAGPDAATPPTPDALAAPPAVPSPPPVESPPAPLPITPAVHTIGIHTSGYQAELDQCLWVRMDLAGASAPIVGAHNNCGGDVVLGLEPGQLVDLAGQGLDGRYAVAGSRDGRPGQNAAEATAGFGAAVILQTCYFEGPDVRLVALVPVP